MFQKKEYFNILLIVEKVISKWTTPFLLNTKNLQYEGLTGLKKSLKPIQGAKET